MKCVRLTLFLAIMATGASCLGHTIFNINSPTFGQITQANTIGGTGLNRIIQVAGRFEF